MPKTPVADCPVCGLPVGKDPHEACLAKLAEADAPTERPAMPCPACGEPNGPNGCTNPDCELRTPA